MNKNFYTRIKQSYPEIIRNELKICALIKMNLSIKEMAGIFLSISAWINTNGLGHIDSVVSTSPVPHICYATSDAYIGNNALEVSNAYNFDASQPIPGCGSVAVDSDFRFNIYIPISFIPTTFNFYYKFNSVSNDTASALLVLYDSNGDEVGNAMWETSITNKNYTLV